MQAAPVEIRQTQIYASWFTRLRDFRARARIDARIRRLSLGNLGDVKPLGQGLPELRSDYGPGYRIYIAQRGTALIVLLAGGDKSCQSAGLRRARELAARWESE